MPDSLLRAAAEEWDEALGRLGVPWGDRVAVVGGGAENLAERLLLAGSPPVAVAAGSIAILAHEVAPGLEDADLDAATPAVLPLPDEFAAVVLAVHAWASRPDLTRVVQELRRVVRRGGYVVIAELDVAAIAESTPRQYPIAAMKLVAPEAFDILASRCVDRSDIEIEMVRAGLAEIASDRFDVVRGVFPNSEAHAAAVRVGLWRGSEDLSADELESLAAVVRSVDGTGPAQDREPWVMCRARRRQ